MKVSEVNRHIKKILQGDPALQNIFVVGEISNFKHHQSGHMYFTLKDNFSSLRSVYFRHENIKCQFKPYDGLEVIARGSISIYEPDGSYQLYVTEMKSAGVGALYLEYDKLKRKLESEGLFSPERKKKIPFLPRTIGIITSPSGAALQDILIAISKRFKNVRVLVAESLVQGPGASRDITSAMDYFNKRHDVDLIVIARGGGSIEDLWSFNEEEVARAISRSIIPVMTAIGHETDFTIADFVADIRAPTPTAVASYALPELSEQLDILLKIQDKLFYFLQNKIRQEKQHLDHLIGERFFDIPKQKIKLAEDTLERYKKYLRRDFERYLELKKVKFDALKDKLISYSPEKIMERGYCYCQNENGEIIKSINDLSVGQLLKLSFVDGFASGRVEYTEEDKSIER